MRLEMFERDRATLASTNTFTQTHRIIAEWFLYYIYIYTSVSPCITCAKQGGAEQKLMPRTEEQEATFFERPFRAQETNAPHGCGLSSILRLRGRLERHPSNILRLRGQPRAALFE